MAAARGISSAPTAFGRDVFARLLLAGRLSLLVGVAGAVLSGVVGALLGALAGWLPGVVDRIVTAAADTLLAIPRLVLLLACAALWRPGVPTLVTVLALTGWMGVARLVRAEVQGLAERDFVAAARTLGATSPRVLFAHVLPNAVAPALVATTLGVGNAIPAGEWAELSGAWGTAAGTELGEHDCRGTRASGLRAVDRARTRPGGGDHGDGCDADRDWLQQRLAGR